MPVYIYFFNLDSKHGIYYAAFVVLLAGISDALDGYIARKYDLTSDLGAILDPIADKLMMLTVIISFTRVGILPKWILIALVLKEVAQVFGGGILYLFKGKQVVPSNIFGKLATVLFYISIFMVILKLPANIVKISFTLMILLNIVAFISYLVIYLKKKENIDLTSN